MVENTTLGFTAASSILYLINNVNDAIPTQDIAPQPIETPKNSINWLNIISDTDPDAVSVAFTQDDSLANLVQSLTDSIEKENNAPPYINRNITNSHLPENKDLFTEYIDTLPQNFREIFKINNEFPFAETNLDIATSNANIFDIMTETTQAPEIIPLAPPPVIPKIEILGTNGKDTLNGTDADEIIKGLGNNDTIYGNGGDDDIYGGLGNDKLYGNDGNDLIYGDDGNDTITGDAGNDIIYGGNGNDNIKGLNDNDILYGESGDDKVYGGNGDDILYGGSGDDTLDGDADNDIIYGGDDNDNIIGDNGDDILLGEAGDDKLNGGNGNDILDGGAGSDNLIGGSGNDTFNQVTIEDTVTAGGGNDIINYKFNNGVGTLQINGNAGNDIINLQDITNNDWILTLANSKVLNYIGGIFSGNALTSDVNIIGNEIDLLTTKNGEIAISNEVIDFNNIEHLIWA